MDLLSPATDAAGTVRSEQQPLGAATIGFSLSSSGPRRTSRTPLVPALAFLAAAVIAVVVFTSSDDPLLVDADPDPDAAAAPATPAASPEAAAGAPDDAPSAARMGPLQLPQDSGMAIGPVDAPMVMVAFESFGCLWCGHMHTRTMPSVLSEYVDADLLRIEARMLPYEPAAEPGARMGAAAGLQDRYWQLAEHLYPFIAGEGDPPAGRELTAQEMGAYRERQSEESLLAEVRRVADDIDLDLERFLADYRSPEVEALVVRDATMARQLGFSGTPAMVINGVPVGGYRSEEVFTDLLDTVLDASTET